MEGNNAEDALLYGYWGKTANATLPDFSPVRGSDEDVFDVGVHPPQSDAEASVVRFQAPMSGNYTVDLFSARRKPMSPPCGDNIDLGLYIETKEGRLFRVAHLVDINKDSVLATEASAPFLSTGLGDPLAFCSAAGS